MKKIIGLIMIAGISYGASVVTPPGIQVNGLATNNNVMVYSDGMLLDSGVAPTNLVSVTNLTADIEALSATNAAQDALIAGNLYAAGTTNKTLIDAAIAPTIKVGDALMESKITMTDLFNLGIIMSNSSTFAASPRGIAIIGDSNAQGYNSGTPPAGEMIDGIIGSHVSVSNRYLTSGWPAYGFVLETNKYVNTRTLNGTSDYYANTSSLWGSELPLGLLLQDALGGDTYWYKSAVGGSVSGSWTNGGTYWGMLEGAYVNATNEWAEAPAPDWAIIHLGGNDASLGKTVASYATNQVQLIDDIRTFYGNVDIKVILVGLPPYSYTTYGAAYDAATRDIAAADTNVFYLSMYDLPITAGGGLAHYDADQQVNDVAPRLFDVIMGDVLGGSSHGDGMDLTGLKVNHEAITDLVSRVAGDLDAALDIPLMPSSVYSNNCIALLDFSNSGTVITNLVTGLEMTQRGVNTFGTNTGWEAAEPGPYISMRTDTTNGFYLASALALSNSSFTVFFRYRPMYDIASAPVDGYALYIRGTTSEATNSIKIKVRNALTVGSSKLPKPSFSFGTAASGYFADSTAIHLTSAAISNEWCSVAFSLDRSDGHIKGYFNGAKEVDQYAGFDCSLSTLNTSAAYGPAIGSRFDAPSPETSKPIYGDMAFFAIFTSVLSDAQVLGLHEQKMVYPH